MQCLTSYASDIGNPPLVGIWSELAINSEVKFFPQKVQWMQINDVIIWSFNIIDIAVIEQNILDKHLDIKQV